MLRFVVYRHIVEHGGAPSRADLAAVVGDLDFRVTTAIGSWWANCAWDSLAILAALHADGRIDSTWADTGEPLTLTVTEGRLDQPDGFVGFAVPAAQWWDDIVLT